MHIIAILEVDEQELTQTGHCFEKEMEWTAPSGITVKDYINAKDCSSFEYAAFVWDTAREEYTQIGRCTETELLCRNRFEERVKKGWIPEYYDSGKVMFKKRPVSVIYGSWEELDATCR